MCKVNPLERSNSQRCCLFLRSLAPLKRPCMSCHTARKLRLRQRRQRKQRATVRRLPCPVQVSIRRCSVRRQSTLGRRARHSLLISRTSGESIGKIVLNQTVPDGEEPDIDLPGGPDATPVPIDDVGGALSFSGESVVGGACCVRSGTDIAPQQFRNGRISR